MPATFLLDHVVIRVNDLDAAIRDYTELGFTVVPGGEHPGLGSRNALIAFEDGTYLELITFREDGPRRVVPKHVGAAELAASPHTALERHWLPWATAPEGFVDFALLPSSIDDAIRDAAARGLKLEGPIPGGRTRPDGQRVAWQFAFADSLDLPFLCADVTRRSLRVPEGEARRHRNGVTGIHTIGVAVNDLAVSLENYGALLGYDPIPPSPKGVFQFVLGRSAVALVAPTADNDRLRGHLSTSGEGPETLALAIPELAITELDQARTHGALIFVGPFWPLRRMSTTN